MYDLLITISSEVFKKYSKRVWRNLWRPHNLELSESRIDTKTETMTLPVFCHWMNSLLLTSMVTSILGLSYCALDEMFRISYHRRYSSLCDIGSTDMSLLLIHWSPSCMYVTLRFPGFSDRKIGSKFATKMIIFGNYETDCFLEAENEHTWEVLSSITGSSEESNVLYFLKRTSC